MMIASFVTGVFSQSLKPYTWEPYKVEFQIPEDFKVDENNSEKFMATAPGINFTMYPKKGENLSIGRMQSAITKWAEDNGLKNIGAATIIDENKFNGFWGVTIEGTKDDYPIMLYLLIHPKDNNISFYVWISYSFAKKPLVNRILENLRPMSAGGTYSDFGQSRNLKPYTWESYKTKFKIPDDFTVTASEGDKFIAGNNNMNFNIYPRKGESLSSEERENAVRKWAEDNNVKGLGKVTVLDESKLNGYWGVFIEGARDGYPEIYMLIINPNDYNIALYVKLSYKVGMEDLALDILKSIAPMY